MAGTDYLIHGDVDMNDHNNNYDAKVNDNAQSSSTSPKVRKKRQKKENEPMTDEKKQEIQQKVKLKIAKTVCEIIDFRVREWNDNNIEDHDDEDIKLKASKEFIFGLTELIYDTSVVLGNDLEQFRKHRAKKTVETKDFMLFPRRNKDIKQKMIGFCTKLQDY
eukprot:UN12821